MRGYYPGESERYHPALAHPVQPGQDPPAGRRSGRRIDWALGIALGVVLGIAIVAAFLLLGSEQTIDAPSVDGGKPVREAKPLSAPRNEP